MPRRPKPGEDATQPIKPTPLSERLTHHQRQEMRRHFERIQPGAFRFECYVYLSRELRLTPRHRDYQGIADVQAIARMRGLMSLFDEAQDAVDVDIWGDTPGPEESEEPAAWERKLRSDWRQPARVFAPDLEGGHAATYKGPTPLVG